MAGEDGWCMLAEFGSIAMMSSFRNFSPCRSDGYVVTIHRITIFPNISRSSCLSAVIRLRLLKRVSRFSLDSTSSEGRKGVPMVCNSKTSKELCSYCIRDRIKIYGHRACAYSFQNASTKGTIYKISTLCNLRGADGSQNGDLRDDGISHKQGPRSTDSNRH